MPWWEQAWVGHAVTILALVVTQAAAIFLIRRQVTAQSEAQREHELWKMKYDAYAQVLQIVTNYFYSREWTSGQVTHKFPADPPTAEEYGQAYGRVRLLTDDSRMASTLMAAFGTSGNPDGSVNQHQVQPSHFQALVRVMRDDLGKGHDPTPEKDFALIDFTSQRVPESRSASPERAG